MVNRKSEKLAMDVFGYGFIFTFHGIYNFEICKGDSGEVAGGLCSQSYFKELWSSYKLRGLLTASHIRKIY